MRDSELERIRRLYAAGQRQVYLEALSALVRATPDDVEVRLEAAQAHARLGVLDTALTHFDVAWRLGVPAELEPDALIGYGLALCHAGRADEAMVRIGETLATHPENVALKAALALALHTAGHVHAALATMLDALIDADESAGALGQHREMLARQCNELLDRAVATA